jgi:hypothetical protein
VLPGSIVLRYQFVALSAPPERFQRHVGVLGRAALGLVAAAGLHLHDGADDPSVRPIPKALICRGGPLDRQRLEELAVELDGALRRHRVDGQRVRRGLLLAPVRLIGERHQGARQLRPLLIPGQVPQPVQVLQRPLLIRHELGHRACLQQDLDDLLVHLAPLHAPGEVDEVAERTMGLDRLDGGGADALQV